MKSKTSPPPGLLLLLLLLSLLQCAASSARASSSPRRLSARAVVATPPISFRQRSPLGRSPGWLSVRGGAVDVLDGEEDYDSEEDESEIDDSESEETETPTSSSSAAGGPPVTMRIATGLGSPLVDRRVEFAASRGRTVLSLKQAVGRTMPGRPPMSSVVLRHHGRTLEDDETVADLLEDLDEDEDESDNGEDGEDDIKVTLTCDMVPPVDAKFAIELREEASRMSTRELVEAYCVNLAGTQYAQELQAREDSEEFRAREEDDSEEENDEEGQFQSSSSGNININHSLNIRRRAMLLRERFEGTFPEETMRLMEEEHQRVAGTRDDSDANNDGGEESIYGLTSHATGTRAHRGGRGRTLKGGAATQVRRTMQRNLNVNWADTTRNSLLFLFFGYFGGRNSFSRAFLLLSSPLCFVVQMRPVKVAAKQLFYAVGEPPGIFLSLLPAPQQAIMSLDYAGVMRGLYGEEALAKGGSEERWLELDRRETDGDRRGDRNLDDDGYDDDDESDYDDNQYDDDEESDYDSEDEY